MNSEEREEMYSRRTTKQDKIDKQLYEMNMTRNANPINMQYNQAIDEPVYEERWGDIKVVDYKLQGDRYELQKMTEIKMKAEFLRNGFHVMNFQFECDPLSGNLTGIISFKARLLVHKQRDFDKFISNRMGLTIKYKK